MVLVTGQLIVRLPIEPPAFVESSGHATACSETDWILVSQTGDEANALSFSQAFHLVPEGTGYYVYVLQISQGAWIL
jgi:hypothetical protein